MEKSVLITIGHPHRELPILPLVKTVVRESIQKSAKMLRKEVAENPKNYGVLFACKIVPADLYWAVFENFDDEKPIAASDNYYCREALRAEKVAENLAKQEAILIAWDNRKNNPHYSWWYQAGKVDYKATNGTFKAQYPKGNLFRSFYEDGWCDAQDEFLDEMDGKI